jgi:hypothetical protein
MRSAVTVVAPALVTEPCTACAKRAAISDDEIPLKPAQRRLLVLRRFVFGVEPDEQKSVLEREIRELAGGVLGHPKGSALDRTAEAGVRVRLTGHERMFS